ncbi:hypothetical protein IE81DRAFT_340492 [Ceraceosorus guamensis]|uniref:Uncharacterized protein n=1 Tax=Ceraceosorus guamensis TaxID=1522189 RepID=A0A316W2C8_9BASI|nr:hypothetical protein IE81DRAFT_340492 [Ceraceosorus guamensis]PWN43839.1 hypothetical protein IE81DRAFT_340492 [Ceraceosorus guamensis]
MYQRENSPPFSPNLHPRLVRVLPLSLSRQELAKMATKSTTTVAAKTPAAQPPNSTGSTASDPQWNKAARPTESPKAGAPTIGKASQNSTSAAATTVPATGPAAENKPNPTSATSDAAAGEAKWNKATTPKAPPKADAPAIGVQTNLSPPPRPKPAAGLVMQQRQAALPNIVTWKPGQPQPTNKRPRAPTKLNDKPPRDFNRDSGDYGVVDLDAFLSNAPTPPPLPVSRVYPKDWLKNVQAFDSLTQEQIRNHIADTSSKYFDRLKAIAQAASLKDSMVKFSAATGMVFLEPTDATRKDPRRPQVDWDSDTFEALAAAQCALNPAMQDAIRNFGLEGKEVSSIDGIKDVGGVYGTEIAFVSMEPDGTEYWAPRPGYAVRTSTYPIVPDTVAVGQLVQGMALESNDGHNPVLAHRISAALQNNAGGPVVNPDVLGCVSNFIYGLTIHELAHFSQHCTKPVWDLDLQHAAAKSAYRTALNQAQSLKQQKEVSYTSPARNKTATVSEHFQDIGLIIQYLAETAASWNANVGMQAPFDSLSQWFAKGKTVTVTNAKGTIRFAHFEFDKNADGAALSAYKAELESAKLAADQKTDYINELARLVDLAAKWAGLRIGYEHQLSKQACNLVRLVKQLDVAHVNQRDVKAPRGLDVVTDFTTYVASFYGAAQQKTIQAMQTELKQTSTATPDTPEAKRRQVMAEIMKDIEPDLKRAAELERDGGKDPVKLAQLRELRAIRYETVFEFGASERFFNLFAMEFHAELNKISKGAPEEFLLNPKRERREYGAQLQEKEGDLNFRLPRGVKRPGRLPTEKQLGILFRYSIEDRHLYEDDKAPEFPADPYGSFKGAALPPWAPSKAKAP